MLSEITGTVTSTIMILSSHIGIEILFSPENNVYIYIYTIDIDIKRELEIYEENDTTNFVSSDVNPRKSD